MNFLFPPALDYHFFDLCSHLIFVKQPQSASIPLAILGSGAFDFADLRSRLVGIHLIEENDIILTEKPSLFVSMPS